MPCRYSVPASLCTALAAALAGNTLYAPAAAEAAEIILPQHRQAFLMSEAIEIAVAGVDEGATQEVGLMPQSAPGVEPYRFEVQGDGSTVAVRLPPGALAPALYQVVLDGKAATTLTVSRGLHQSPLYVSQTINEERLPQSGGNFSVSNAFSFGILDQGKASDEPRRLSPGMQAQQRLVAADVPSLIYMYWTGYVLHKPWGDRKTWAARDMTEAMRLFNFHVAQRLRRFGPNILSVGTLDEPGLAWGTTPAGGLASGFPNWDAAYWYEQRGWDFTKDPAARPADDWMKYMRIRCAMLGEQNLQARQDIQTVWPECVFSTDLYAPHAIMDGTDPWNQQVNQIPSTHVFLDWGGGKLSAIGGLYLEKSHDPTAKVAHAMNGQLFGERVPQPQTRYAYHLMLNSLLAAGLNSNWWLNYGGMSDEDLLAVNEPAARIGPLLDQMAPRGHDTALLWSFTEIAMRCKDITAKEAQKKSGEQIKRMVADMPENALSDEGELNINAYSVGSNYKFQVLNMHQALTRAGYPSHIVHERLLPGGGLEKYRTLVLVGQTFELPAEVRKAIGAFVPRGGRLVVDRTCSVDFGEQVVPVDADLKDAGYRWAAAFGLEEEQFRHARAASYVKTNHSMDSIARNAVPAVKEAMAETDSRPVLKCESAWLGAERHTAGDAELIMVINAHEELPDIPEDEGYWIYNYAPYEISYSLPRIGPDREVYLIEGLDWRKLTKVENPESVQAVRFEPGEMKLYLSVPRRPQLAAAVEQDGGYLEVSAELKDQNVPWPVTISLFDPGGEELLKVYRSVNADGKLQQRIPLGANAASGKYKLTVDGRLFKETAIVAYRAAAAEAESISEPVRIFDRTTMEKFLAEKPQITIALAGEAYRGAAQKLAAGLQKAGVDAEIKAEQDVWRKAMYPRVWDPYITVHRFSDKAAAAGAKQVARKATIETVGYNHHEVRDIGTGENIEKWREPGTLLNVIGRGLVIEERGRLDAYEKGCQLLVGERGRLEVLRGAAEEVKTTGEVRRRWERPWHKLQHHVGGHHLVPQLPEAYRADEHLILIGDSNSSEPVRVLQASELLMQVADKRYPGPGKSLVSFAWSPFAVEKNVILIAATDTKGVEAGVQAVVELAGKQ